MYCLLIVTVVAFVLGALAILFDDALIGIFIKDNPEAVEYAKIKLFMIALPYFICGWMEVFVGALRGIGRAIPPLVSTIFGVCVFRMGWTLTVFHFFHTAEILFVSYPISWFVTAVISGVLFAHYFKKEAKEL